jgi:DNA-binding CsgD family transcriptional regulator
LPVKSYALNRDGLHGPDGPGSLLRVKADGSLEDMPLRGKSGLLSMPKPVLRWVEENVRWLNRGAMDASIRPLVWRTHERQMEFHLSRQWGTKGYLLMFRRVRDETGSSTGLTAREREVMQWVCAGKSNGEIATILTISAHTVKDHLKQVYIKLGVENRTAAARAWLDGNTTNPHEGTLIKDAL